MMDNNDSSAIAIIRKIDAFPPALLLAQPEPQLEPF
jgi:hypothetical protein